MFELFGLISTLDVARYIPAWTVPLDLVRALITDPLSNIIASDPADSISRTPPVILTGPVRVAPPETLNPSLNVIPPSAEIPSTA